MCTHMLTDIVGDWRRAVESGTIWEKMSGEGREKRIEGRKRGGEKGTAEIKRDNP